MRSRERFSNRELPIRSLSDGLRRYLGKVNARCASLADQSGDHDGDVEFLNAKAAVLSQQLAEAQRQLLDLNRELAEARESRRQLMAYVNESRFPVRPFREVAMDKAQALKPIEEAAEAFGAWQNWDRGKGIGNDEELVRSIVDECADTIQAAVNLAAACGCDDMTKAMAACWRRNHERGRC